MENTKPKINPWTILFLILLIIVIVLAAEYLLLGSGSGKTKVDKLEKREVTR